MDFGGQMVDFDFYDNPGLLCNHDCCIMLDDQDIDIFYF